MKKHRLFLIKIICIVSMLLFVFYLHFTKTNLNSVSNDIYLDNSKIHGTGVFTNKDYKKGDIIIPSLFPHNKNKEPLYDIISTSKFQNYIINYGKYFNHCSTNFNADIITDDYVIFKFIAIKDIPMNSEITANYDIVNSKFPFIAKSKVSYATC